LVMDLGGTFRSIFSFLSSLPAFSRPIFMDNDTDILTWRRWKHSNNLDDIARRLLLLH
jgi:hypothetical protein